MSIATDGAAGEGFEGKDTVKVNTGESKGSANVLVEVKHCELQGG